MRRATLFLVTTSIAILCGAKVALASASEQPTVLAVQLKNLQQSGKVLAALWTVRSDACTLQLVFPWSFQQKIAYAGPVAQPPPAVRVWLLGPDGAQIAPTWRSPAPTPKELSCVRCTGYEVQYKFPLYTDKVAVAIAVGINDDFYVDPLQSLLDK
jgi:hypothetical protein